MKGQIMDSQLTTTAILEYGQKVFSHKKITTVLPDGSKHQYTFSDLYKRVKKLCNALQNKLGIQKEDMVGTFAWNNFQHLELYYAAPGVAAICHTINIRLSTPQINFIINHAQDKVIFIDATLVKLLEPIAHELTTVKHYIILNATKDFSCTLPNIIHYEDLIEDQSDQFQFEQVSENDACGLCYTSGTTGNPKGALYSHRSTYLHAQAILSPNAGNYSANDTVLLIVPQFHVMAWGFPYMCLLAGANMVLPSSNLKPDQIIKILEEEKVTKANGVPSIWLGVYNEMKKSPPKQKLALKEYLVGGSALPASLIKDFENDFGIKGVHAWGMTETSPLGTISRLQTKHRDLPTNQQIAIRAKQGIPIPGISIRIVGDNEKVLPNDGMTFGELQIKGAWVINSYFKTDSMESFTKDSWFRTGDIATIDEDQYMQITDRTKDVIKSGGEWISSVALELALLSHPAIKEVSVIAIPDKKWTERPLAVIVLENKNNNPTDDKLKEFLSPDFAKYQFPDKFVFVKEIPKTSVGKFNKKEMRRLYANGELN